MDSATLHDKIEQTVKSGKPKMYFDLLGTESLRCWLNVYMPGEGTAGLHYHQSDETFTVIESEARSRIATATGLSLKKDPWC